MAVMSCSQRAPSDFTLEPEAEAIGTGPVNWCRRPLYLKRLASPRYAPLETIAPALTRSPGRPPLPFAGTVRARPHRPSPSLIVQWARGGSARRCLPSDPVTAQRVRGGSPLIVRQRWAGSASGAAHLPTTLRYSPRLCSSRMSAVAAWNQLLWNQWFVPYSPGHSLILHRGSPWCRDRHKRSWR
jgi:hypothetical protein